jgi:outer membrane protein TolC
MVNEDAYSFILEDNIDYKMLATQEKLMKLNMNRMRASYLPSVAGFYQYQDKTQKADFDFTINHIIGVQVDFPITTSGSRIAKVSQARVEYEKAVNTREQEANRLIMAAQQASFNYRNAMEKYNNEKQNFELSEKVYHSTTEKYKEGFVSSLELSLINNQYLQAQLSYSMAVQELLSAKTELDKAYNRL